MTDAHPEYRVEGYDNVQPEYDQPYLRGADFNPNVVYKNAGDPDKQAEHQVELVKDLPVDDFYVNAHAEPTNPTYPQVVDPGAVPYAVASGDTESKGEKIARLKREIEALENQPDLEPHQPNGEPLYPHRTEGSIKPEGPEGTASTGDENYLREPGDHNSQPVGDPVGAETTPTPDSEKPAEVDFEVNEYESRLQHQNAQTDSVDAQGNVNPEAKDRVDSESSEDNVVELNKADDNKPKFSGPADDK